MKFFPSFYLLHLVYQCIYKPILFYPQYYHISLPAHCIQSKVGGIFRSHRVIFFKMQQPHYAVSNKEATVFTQSADIKKTSNPNYIRKQSTESIPSLLGPFQINQYLMSRFFTNNINDVQSKSNDLIALKSLFKIYLVDMNQLNLLTTLHHCGKRNIDFFQLIDGATFEGRMKVASEQMNARGISILLYAIPSITSSKGEKYSSKLMKIIEQQLESCPDLFDGRGFSNSLFGMRHLDWEKEASYSLLKAFVTVAGRSKETLTRVDRFIDNVSIPMTPAGIGSAFIGIQGIPAKHQSMRALKASIIHLLSNSIRDHILSDERTEGSMGPHILSNVMLGLKLSPSDSMEVKRVLTQLTSWIRHHPHLLMNMTMKEFSMFVWGLQSMSSHDQALTELLTTINHILDDVPSSKRLRIASINELGHLIRGLSGLSSDHEEVRYFIVHVSEMIAADSSDKMSCEKSENNFNALVMSLLGLQNLSTDYVEVEQLFDRLARRIYQVRDGHLNERSIANGLYGLHNANSSSPAVRDILTVIAEELENPQLRFGTVPAFQNYTGQHLGMCLYGLQQMSFTPRTAAEGQGEGVVERVVEGIAYQLKASSAVKTKLTGLNIASAMYGLQHMTTDAPSVRQILRAIYCNIMTDTVPLHHSTVSRHYPAATDQLPPIQVSGQELAMMLHGMQDMNNHHDNGQEVHSMVGAIAQILDFNIHRKTDSLGNGTDMEEFRMSPREIANCFHSLRCMGGGGWALSFDSTDFYQGWLHTDEDSDSLPTRSTNLSSDSRSSASNAAKLALRQSSSHSESSTPTNHRHRRRKLSPEMRHLLKGLLHALRVRPHPLTLTQVVLSLYGLQGFSDASTIVRNILTELAADLQLDVEGPDRKEGSIETYLIGNALFGMQNMTSRHPVTRNILKSLASVMDSVPATAPISPQTISSSFFGLQGMSSDHAETRLLLTALTHKLRDMPLSSRFSGQNIGSSLWGLRNMSTSYIDADGVICDNHEVLRTLQALGDRIRQSSADLTGQNLANAFYGLQGMCNEVSEVNHVLSALAHKFILSSPKLSWLDIGMSLYGLRNMDMDSPEVRVILGTILHKMKQNDTNDRLELQHLTLAIAGLTNFTPWIRDDFLKIISQKSEIDFIE